MAFEVGHFCFFSTSKIPDHPIVNTRKVGQIIGLGTVYTGTDGLKYRQIEVLDFYGKWVFHDEVTNNNLSSISGVSWQFFEELADKNEIFEKDLQFFNKTPDYFLNILPSRLKSTYLDSNTILKAISLLENKEIDYLHKEPILIRYLEELMNIFKFVCYNYPNTIKEYIENVSDDHYHADNKQGHYYSICDTFDDIIYQFHFSWTSRRNKVSGFKDHINNKRNKLSDNRIEELRVACIVLTEEIRNFVCSSTSGDENYVDELEYLKKIKRANEIVQRIIKLE